jgi:hypothetical protein
LRSFCHQAGLPATTAKNADAGKTTTDSENNEYRRSHVVQALYPFLSESVVVCVHASTGVNTPLPQCPAKVSQ